MSAVQNFVTFSDGSRMPVIGLGTWQVIFNQKSCFYVQCWFNSTFNFHFKSPKEEVKAAVSAALEAGYRHIDAAYNYLNEDAIGESLDQWISSGKVKRSDLFIVTKVNISIWIVEPSTVDWTLKLVSCRWSETDRKMWRNSWGNRWPSWNWTTRTFTSFISPSEWSANTTTTSSPWTNEATLSWTWKRIWSPCGR